MFLGFFFLNIKLLGFPLLFTSKDISVLFFSEILLVAALILCLILTYSIHRKLKSQKGITANLS